MDTKHVHKMCRLALFEQKESRKALAVASYYKRDYIGLGLLSNLLQITIAYALIAVAVILVNADFFIRNFYKIDFYKLAALAIAAYVLMLGLYSVLVFTLRRLQYARAKRKVRNYYIALNRMYEENKAGQNKGDS